MEIIKKKINSPPQKKKSLYKTEWCRSQEELGECPYGPKCQFAHSIEELRVLDRHPRYKTEMCKTVSVLIIIVLGKGNLSIR